jgi:hypothetical protein
MNELKDAFARSVHDEPPLRTTREEILRSGRSRHQRRSGLAAVGGLAVAGLVVTAVVALPRLQHGGVGSAAGAGQSESAVVKTGATEGQPKPTTADTANSDATPSWPAVAGLEDVKAARTVKLNAILQAAKAQLTAAGYGVPELGADASMGALFNTATPAGLYNMKLAVSQNGKTGGIVLSTGVLLAGARLAPDCKVPTETCRTVQLPDGRQARFVDERSAGAVARRVSVVGDTVTDVRFLQDAGVGLTVSDDLLLALATDPALDLSAVPLLTADQRTAVDQALAAEANHPSPTTKPTSSDLKAG